MDRKTNNCVALGDKAIIMKTEVTPRVLQGTKDMIPKGEHKLYKTDMKSTA